MSKQDFAVDPDSGCWVWQKRRDKDGYGQLNREGYRRAHRWYYEKFVGPIPSELQLDHLCRNRACVNPDHLEAVTAAENAARSPVFGRAKTHCKHGHEFTEENTYRGPSGRRACRQCWRDRSKARYAQVAA